MNSLVFYCSLGCVLVMLPGKAGCMRTFMCCSLLLIELSVIGETRILDTVICFTIIFIRCI